MEKKEFINKQRSKTQYNSSAKINLGLKVLNKRPDGYHNISSIFVEIDLLDKLTFTKSSSFTLTSNNSSLSCNSNNTIHQAYQLMKKMTNSNQNFSIYLTKNIPIGSGLGGGSGNAATTLKILNILWNLKLNHHQLIELSKKIGSDVPFFIRGGAQYIKGTGDILFPIDNTFLRNISILLICPAFSIKTKWAYSHLKKSLNQKNSNDKFHPLSNNIDWGVFENDFEELIIQTYPEISDIKKKLVNHGALYAGLSGSGSTMFGIFDDNKKVACARKTLNTYTSYISKPIFP